MTGLASDGDRGDPGSLRILFLVSAHNSLSQRAWIALTELGHDVTVAVVDSAAAMEAAVGAHRPELIVVPDAEEAHPRVDLGHASLPDRAPRPARRPRTVVAGLGDRARDARVGRDGARGRRRARRRRRLGHAHASRTREVGKSSLYRHEVRRAAIEALVEAVGRIVDGGAAPERSTPATGA